MKVALLGLGGDFDKGIGEGTQRYVYEIYNNIKKELGGDISRFSYPSLGPYLSALAFEDFRGYDLIHIPKFRLGFPMRRGRAATVTTEHDFQPIFAPELDADRSGGFKGWLHTKLLREGLIHSLKSDYIIANSTLTRDDALRLGYEKRKIYVVNHGLDKRFFKELPRRRKRPFRVGYLGAFRIRKNVSFALKAFMATAAKDMRMALYGNNSYQYNELAAASRRDRRISFCGFAPEGKLVEIYDSFDAFLFPSLYEGFGFPILEAQARGLPVIIYRDGKIPREVRRHCFEARDEEEMSEMLEDLNENGYDPKARAAAMRYARSFTWERCARETLSVYRKVS